MLFWQVALKDLVEAVRDKSSWLILLLMPVVLIIILTAVFGGIDTDPSFFPAKIALVNLDKAATPGLNLGQQFVDFLNSDEMKEILIVQPVASASEAEKLIKDGEVSTAVIIPATFTQAFFSPVKADIQVLGDAGSTIVPRTVKAIVESYATVLEANRIQFAAVSTTISQLQLRPELTQQMMAELAHQAIIQELPLTFAEQTEKGKAKVPIKAYFSAGTAVMFLLFTGNTGIFAIIDERERKTLLRLKTSRLTKASFIFGKFLAVLILGLAQFTSLILFTSLVLKIDWGTSLAGLIFITLAGVTCTAALSIFIGAITKSANVANSVNWVAIQALAFLGGSYLPISSMPPFIQFLSKFTVNGQAMRGYLQLMSGGGLQDVLEIGLLLFSSGVVFLALGSYFLKYNEEGV